MKKKLFLIITLFTLSFSNLTYSASWLDSLTDKLMNSIGADKLMDKVSEMENIVGQLEKLGKDLESFDIDELCRQMSVKAFDKYKELDCDFLPKNYKNMTWKEIQQWNDENKDKLEEWSKTIDPEKLEEANKWATENIIPMTDPVMNKVKEMEKPLLDLQNNLNETEPLLDNFIDGYRNLYKVLQNKEQALEYLSQFPEWHQAQDKLKDFAKYYAEGDKIKAFKTLDEITGLFSNSKAGKGWKILLENSSALHIGKYVSKVIKTLVKFSGSNDLDSISESQIEQFIEEYIKEFKSKTDIKDNVDGEVASKIEDKIKEYTNNAEHLPKLAESLNELQNSEIGKLIGKQLEGKGKEALEDVMSKYSGVDKKTIQDTGILDRILDFASSFFTVK